MSSPIKSIFYDVPQLAAATVGGAVGTGISMLSNWGICAAGVSTVESSCVTIFMNVLSDGSNTTEELIKNGCRKVVVDTIETCAESAISGAVITVIFCGACAAFSALVTDQFRHLRSGRQYSQI